ncbi:MAG: hypothetical protein H8D67_14870 [Deltaproteobacteria bacterium]|nr:hypothetical protein [Deltaproteobacteria bacterium]
MPIHLLPNKRFGRSILGKKKDKIAPDTPLMIEHLPNEKEYIEAAKFIRKIASEEGIDL